MYENIPDLLAECLESDMDKRRRDVRFCSDPCLRAALALVLCCYEHCRLLFTSFGGRLPKPLGDPDRKSFPWELLPDRFTTAEAVTLGENRGFSKRTVYRLINKLDGLKINRLTLGCYEKIK